MTRNITAITRSTEGSPPLSPEGKHALQISLGSFLQHVPKGEKPPKMNAPEEPVTIRGINRVGTGVESSDKPCNMTIARFHHTEPPKKIFGG